MEGLMPHANARDGTRLYFEDTGAGTPLLFIHEFAGDHRSWEPQVRFFSRYFRCVAYAARGFPPSDIPEDSERYSQAIARGDALAVLDHLKIDRAHIVGLSMGGFAALHFGITYPQRARALVIAGCVFPRQLVRSSSEIRPRPDAGPVPEQGSARLGRIRAATRRAVRHRPRAHHARRADAPPVALRADRRHEADHPAGAHRHR
jgi:pimeloyl-ACP methyl ester carboxylesterase